MDLTLSDGRKIFVNSDEVCPSDRAIGLRYLERRKAMGGLADYTDEELYDFKDRLKRKRIYGRGPEQAAERENKREMIKRVNAELDRRKLPRTRPGDTRRYGPGAARFQRAGEAAA